MNFSWGALTGKLHKQVVVRQFGRRALNGEYGSLISNVFMRLPCNLNRLGKYQFEAGWFCALSLSLR